MGFPVCCAEVYFPIPFLRMPDILGFLRNLVFFLVHVLALLHFPHIEDPLSSTATATATSAAEVARPSEVSPPVIRRLLPVARFGESRENACECAVCLCEFSEEVEIRRMRNCNHIFHRTCVDPWIDQNQKTCPICRTPFVTN
ncbi:unnamed protein product [Sphenostylis stenocarpa]|uniref:RING-type domain-containing protein n=1 Tax=Sphenostylis stenocarpa TaxID=92480 RepID=A0AA86SRA8_9FABA|nr:unnamed protein product [Sphenostylis stenocarpa]